MMFNGNVAPPATMLSAGAANAGVASPADPIMAVAARATANFLDNFIWFFLRSWI
jgi:hypothetical protein